VAEVVKRIDALNELMKIYCCLLVRRSPGRPP
jgi:hypothetical protein